MAKKHSLPLFLKGTVTAKAYELWLKRKAASHARRDRRRGRNCTEAAYRDQIHEAVVRSGGRDAYTGEALHWHLMSTYRNEESKAGRRAYKARFALLPTVDHVCVAPTNSHFNICAWRTNDAKNDLSLDSFVELCQRVLEHAGYRVRNHRATEN
jgi:hypothetical protein